MVIRNHRENCGICHAITCEHTRAARAIQEAARLLNQSEQDSTPPDPRDAEIARLKAEVAKLDRLRRESSVVIVAQSEEMDAMRRTHKDECDKLRGLIEAGINPARLEADLAAHKRALAAGPAALRRFGDEDICARAALAEVEAAQAAAMKEK